MKKISILILTAALVACHARAPQNADQDVSMVRGKALFETHCAPCHGDKGNGSGPLAQYVQPKPRDLTSGIFKYRATRGPIPSDTDLLQTMKVGIPGTSMPGWDLLSLNDWKSILSYVKTLIPSLANQKPGQPFEIPQEPTTTPASIQLGHDLYTNRGCISCHGDHAMGDGSAAGHLKDAWGNPITPRDLTHGPLKWGNTSKDMYRTLAFGVPGTPMPAFEHTFTSDQIWGLVHYIKSLQAPLPKGYDPSSPKRNLITVTQATGAIPSDPKDAAWDKVTAVPIFLKPLQAQPGLTEWANVKALHNGREVAYLLTWLDTHPDSGANGHDGVALQFPENMIPNAADVPFVGMGSPKNPVTIWLWKNNALQGFTSTGVGHMTAVSSLPSGASGTGRYDHGEWQVVIKLPKTAMGKGSEPDENSKMGFLSLALWDGSTKTNPGPETFSEWMIYELK